MRSGYCGLASPGPVPINSVRSPEVPGHQGPFPQRNGEDMRHRSQGWSGNRYARGRMCLQGTQRLPDHPKVTRHTGMPGAVPLVLFHRYPFCNVPEHVSGGEVHKRGREFSHSDIIPGTDCIGPFRVPDLIRSRVRPRPFRDPGFHPFEECRREERVFPVGLCRRSGIPPVPRQGAPQ